MTVRDLNGSTDKLVCAIGGLSGMTFGTFAAIVKFDTVASDRALGHLHNSGGTFVASPLQSGSGSTWVMNDGATGSDSGITISTGVWYLCVVRKATGTIAPRFSVYNLNTPGWSHAAGGSSLVNWTAPGAGGNVQFSFQDNAGDIFDGRVAARGLWSNTLPWTADASGDTAIQNAGLEKAAYNWAAQNPSAWWLFNQPSTSVPVDDLSATGTADQSSITGTTVINGDDPPGFDFSLSALNALQSAQSFPRWSPPWIEPTPTPFQALGSTEAVTQIILSDTGTAADAISVVSIDDYQATPNPFPAFRTPFREPNATPFQLQGDATGPVSVSLTDTGTGTDDLIVDTGVDKNQAGPQTAWMFLEPNAAAFQLLGDTSGSQSVSLTDTGAGSDAVTVSATVPLDDAGAGADAVPVAGGGPLADAGAGADAATVDADVPLTDAGAGADSISVNTGTDSYQTWPQNFPVFTAPFVEPQAVPFQLLGDRSGVAQISLTDIAVGADSLAVAADVALSDSGAGADAVTVDAALPLTDVGAGSDVLAAAASVPLSDAGTGDDQLGVVIFTVTDANQAPLQRFGWGLLRPDGHIPLQMLGGRAPAAALVNAQSTATVTTGRTSVQAVSASQTSTPTLSGASSVPSVSD